VSFPWLSDSYESTWARMMQLGAGPNSGALLLPEVGDEVLVAFEFGRVDHPVVVGGLYNGVDTPVGVKDLVDNGTVKRRTFISRKGHKVTFFDGADETGIQLETAGGLTIHLDDKASTLTIKGDHGRHPGAVQPVDQGRRQRRHPGQRDGLIASQRQPDRQGRHREHQLMDAD